MAWAVAWVMAYALVFQIVLTSALIVSSASATAHPDPSDPLAVLCLGAGTQPTGDQGGPAKAAVHCLACFARVDAAVLPPPPASPVIDRVAIELEYRAIVREALRVVAHRPPQQPRAPPRFA